MSIAPRRSDSLVNAVAKLHGARLVLGDNHPGLSVRLEFDALAAAATQPTAA